MKTRLWTALILAGAVFLLLVPYVGDNDFWFHLRTGEFMWEKGIFPRTDPFSFTALGVSWVNHEWSAQLLFYATLKWGGFRAISVLVGLVGVMFFVVLTRRSCFHSWLTPVLIVVAAYALQPFFVPRPQIFAYVLAAAFIVCLKVFIEEYDKRYLLMVPLVVGVWGNVHASVVIVPLVYGAILGAEVLARLVPSMASYRMARRDLVILIGVMVLSSGLSLANPFGVSVYEYAFQPLRHREAYHTLIETQPIYKHLSSPSVVAAFILHLLLGAAMVWRAARPDASRRTHLFGYLFFAGIFFMPLVSLKYLPFAWALMFPFLLPWIDTLWPGEKPTLVGALAGLLVGLAIFFHQGHLAKDPHGEWPHNAVAFLAQHVKGNTYNPYTWGGYLLWQNKGKPVFIDGRFEMFADRVYFDALDFEEGKRVDEVTDRYALSVAIARPWTALAYTLSFRKDWSLVYWDNFGMIYVRRDGTNDEAIRKFALEIPYINDSMEAVIRKVSSAQLPALVANYEEAVRRRPDLLLGRFRLGVLYQKGGDCRRAILQWSELIHMDKRLGGAHYKLAECYGTLGDYARAAQERALGDRYASRQRWWYGRL